MTKITTTMQEKIDSSLEYFYPKTADGYIVKYINLFIACGVLDEPEDHIIHNGNTMWIYSVGFSKN
jgi:hypothetical protein